MPFLFVYGSLKQGFPNEHVNTGRRVAGSYRTQQAFPMFLLGQGEVPCILCGPDAAGHQVVGELYEVTPQDLARMDRLERIGEEGGYERIELAIERFDVEPPQLVRAGTYVKQAHAVPQAEARVGPLPEYLIEHTARFLWKGSD